MKQSKRDFWKGKKLHGDKFWRNFKRIRQLEDANPEKYCFAHLDSIAVAHNGEERLDFDDMNSLKDSARDTGKCMEEAKELGSCWCGKFRESGVYDERVGFVSHQEIQEAVDEVFLELHKDGEE